MARFWGRLDLVILEGKVPKENPQGQGSMDAEEAILTVCKAVSTQISQDLAPSSLALH